MNKLFIFISILCLPLVSFSQSYTSNMIGKLDTVYEKDASNPKLVHEYVYDSAKFLYAAGNLLNGKRDGIWRTYFDNHFLYTVEEYRNGEKEGYSLMLNSSGYMMKEENYVKGIKQGLFKTYAANGKLKMEENFINGIQVGWRRTYYPEGGVQENGYFNKEGVRDSVNQWFYGNGKLLVQYIYVKGDIYGPSKSYYDNGSLKGEGNFKANYEDGYWKEYYDTGKLKAEGNYLAGKKTGTWKLYDEGGLPMKTQEYKDGTMISEKAIDSKNYSTTNTVKIIDKNGTKTVPVKINNLSDIDFILDTGASETTVTEDVVSSMIRQKLVTVADFLPGKEYILADGSVVKSPRFIIRKMEVGGKIFENIEASITSANAEPLLGQNVLSKFKSVKQDNKNGIVIFEQ